MNTTATVLFLGVLVLGLVALLQWTARQPLFAIRGISVVGDVAHNNDVTLQANLAGKMHGTFFTIDLNATKAAFEAVPWVRKAVVRREFPNRLRVVLQEQQAAAYWGDDSESRLLNNFGEVFEANLGEVDHDDMPRLDGPLEQAGQVLGMYRTLAPLLAPLDMALNQLTLTKRGGWSLQTGAGGEIELGRGTAEEITRRVERFIGTVAQVAQEYGRTVDAIEQADLRYPEGYALRLRGVTTLAVPAPVPAPKPKPKEH